MKLPDAASLNYTTGSHFSSMIKDGIIHCRLDGGESVARMVPHHDPLTVHSLLDGDRFQKPARFHKISKETLFSELFYFYFICYLVIICLE